MFKKLFLSLIFFFLLFFLLTSPVWAEKSLVVINEIAWMGTSNSSNDEWIELYNPTSKEIILDGWTLKSKSGKLKISLKGKIFANGFYLLERTDDNSISSIKADLIYKGSLNNKGEELFLYDSEGNLVDTLNCSSGWFAGNNDLKKTMERKNPFIYGNDASNWQTSSLIGGTPRRKNSLTMKESDKELTKKGKLLMEEKRGDMFDIKKQTISIQDKIKIRKSNSLIYALFISLASAILIIFLRINIFDEEFKN